MWDSSPPVLAAPATFASVQIGRIKDTKPAVPVAFLSSLAFAPACRFSPCPLRLALTVNPCRFAKQMRRLQITQFRNQTPPCPLNPICRSPRSSTKQPPRNNPAPKNQNPSRSDFWAAQSRSATRIATGHCHENESPRSLRPATRQTSTARFRRATPAPEPPRSTTGLCVK